MVVRSTQQRGASAAETDWTFGGLWPYPPRWFDTVDGRLHYIDEGPRDGRPVVLVHGNPTWGFLYRNFVGPLVEAGCRVIVPDFLGFGRSDKPADPSRYGTLDHVRRTDELLESLDLHEAVVAPQDWGGLALAWAAKHPERIAGLFIMNTSAHNPIVPWKLPIPLRLFRTPLGKVLVQGLGGFHRGFLFGVGTLRKDRLTEDVRAAYWAPHPSWSSRTGVLAFPREIPTSPSGPLAPFLVSLQNDLAARFRNTPVRIVWAMDDVGFTPDMIERDWLRTFPHADVHRLFDAGHYLQEDAHERIVPLLLSFLSDLESSGAALSPPDGNDA